jgi:hypothetical protein
MAEVATPQTLFIEHIKSEVEHVLSEKRNGGYDDIRPVGKDLLNMRDEISKAVWKYFQKMLLNNRIDQASHTIEQLGQFCLKDRHHEDLRAIRSHIRRNSEVAAKPKHRFSSPGRHYEAMLRRELAQQVELIFKARIELGGLCFDEGLKITDVKPAAMPAMLFDILQAGGQDGRASSRERIKEGYFL